MDENLSQDEVEGKKIKDYIIDTKNIDNKLREEHGIMENQEPRGVLEIQEKHQVEEIIKEETVENIAKPETNIDILAAHTLKPMEISVNDSGINITDKTTDSFLRCIGDNVPTILEIINSLPSSPKRRQLPVIQQDTESRKITVSKNTESLEKAVSKNSELLNKDNSEKSGSVENLVNKTNESFNKVMKKNTELSEKLVHKKVELPGKTSSLQNGLHQHKSKRTFLAQGSIKVVDHVCLICDHN
ncbi:unnamed protein product [Mytilus coruscus]|uniref:Uncharacterized protein n=1 Tax=Mytilus coruscus TaxID=42192 RepID=A0A6J8AN37_MYTCO|nr:unnamed protein product [Mytilus coruscus]